MLTNNTTTTKDNRVLLEQVSEQDVSFFIGSMKQRGRISSFAKFLSILCVCENEGLKKNQVFFFLSLLFDFPY